MQLKTFAIAALAAVSSVVALDAPASSSSQRMQLVRRTDDRQLYNFAKSSHHYKSGDAFCDAYRCACVNYKPKGNLTFGYTYCKPGGYSGKAKEEALAYCLFADSKNKPVLVNKHLAAVTNSTIV